VRDVQSGLHPLHLITMLAGHRGPAVLWQSVGRRRADRLEDRGPPNHPKHHRHARHGEAKWSGKAVHKFNRKRLEYCLKNGEPPWVAP
jgi:hypothetical protein